MHKTGRTWALVLAAGEGSRLRTLTTMTCGTAVPKQFCSLRGGPSLLQEALRRARAIADPQHTCVIVAREHRRWWEPMLQVVPRDDVIRDNVIVQPRNRGTANGILLPLLHIMQRDPHACIVLLPSDQHVCHESIMARSLRQAVEQLSSRDREALLLGIEPDEVDPQLGYIVPGEVDSQGARRVRQFVEKPPHALARELIMAGALWNAFIVVARAPALLDLFTPRFGHIVTEMQAVVARDCANPVEPVAAPALYEALPQIDFSHMVLPGQESALRVLAVPACGWSDLGTPERVARTLSGIDMMQPAEEESMRLFEGHLSLAAQHLQARRP